MILKHLKRSGIEYSSLGEPISKESILEYLPFPFEGQETMLKVYSETDGVNFPYGCFIYRDTFYPVSDNSYNLLDIGAFLSFSSRGSKILEIHQSLIQNPDTKRIGDCHLPFAIGSSGDYFLIQKFTGIIRFLPNETPGFITDVAPSFSQFVQSLTSQMR